MAQADSADDPAPYVHPKDRLNQASTGTVTLQVTVALIFWPIAGGLTVLGLHLLHLQQTVEVVQDGVRIVQTYGVWALVSGLGALVALIIAMASTMAASRAVVANRRLKSLNAWVKRTSKPVVMTAEEEAESVAEGQAALMEENRRNRERWALARDVADELRYRHRRGY